MELLVFVLASAMVIAGALGVVLRSNPVHAALSLVLTLFGVAVHFVSLHAHFLAAVQVIVYAGAIVVLFLFVIMLLGVDKSEDLSIEPFPIQRPAAVAIGVAVSGLVIAAITRAADTLGKSADLLRAEQGGTTQGKVDLENQLAYDNVNELARNLFGDHVFAFEFTSILLIVAVAGTVLLTRKSKRTTPATAEEPVS
jgi:NADH-quinone oxidoreductase subunit J